MIQRLRLRWKTCRHCDSGYLCLCVARGRIMASAREIFFSFRARMNDYYSGRNGYFEICLFIFYLTRQAARCSNLVGGTSVPLQTQTPFANLQQSAEHVARARKVISRACYYPFYCDHRACLRHQSTPQEGLSGSSAHTLAYSFRSQSQPRALYSSLRTLEVPQL